MEEEKRQKGRLLTLTTAQQSHYCTGSIARLIAQQVCRILFSRLQGKPVLRLSVKNTRAKYPQAACTDIRTVAQAMTPCSTFDRLTRMPYLARLVICRDVFRNRDLSCARGSCWWKSRELGRVQWICVWRNGNRLGIRTLVWGSSVYLEEKRSW